ncbi:MAG: hypothetical protein MJZ06_09710 [Bacteroidaceae bacterium]|nr:hypothetical protein [Bacteroidaceae bacterium]
MKLTRSYIHAIAVSVILLAGCTAGTQDRDIKEFTIKDAQGNSLEAQAYIPQGWSNKEGGPAVFVLDNSLFNDGMLWRGIDSLYECNVLKPIVIARLHDKRGTCSAETFSTSFIPYVQENFNAGVTENIFFGVGNEADTGLAISMSGNARIDEYWCYSPANSDLSGYGMLPQETSYRICYGAKEEIGRFEYYPALLNSIRKRGGHVESWTYDGSADPDWWKAWFLYELEKRFPASQDSSLK